ncbi:MAG: hypothetical protein IRZ33_02140 [Alicyclobacillaceae bacterium]|nr:hypothetical protein [Alicyclobacillaceae bacterium]
MAVRQLEVRTVFAPDQLRRRLEEAGAQIVDDGGAMHTVRLVAADGDWTAVVETLARFVVHEWSAAYIAHRLAVRHRYLDADEQAHVAALVRKALEQVWAETTDTTVWAETAKAVIGQAALRGTRVELDGVARFQMRDFVRQVEAAVEECVGHYLADREFEQFVLMLRLMMEAQPASGGELHLFCADGKAWVCTPSGEPVCDPDVLAAAAEVSEDGEVNCEDLAMSILITKAPAHVVIHDVAGAQPWPSFTETVERVFIGRASRCTGCSACTQLSAARPGEASLS